MQLRHLENLLGLTLMLLSLNLFNSCSKMDDNSLPPDAWEHIYFQSFEINPTRNYILGRLINNSKYTLTSCNFRVEIYPESSNSAHPLTLNPINRDELPSSLKPTLTEDFLMRETLKPGYSTEIYFELWLNELSGPAVFTREMIEVKGRIPH